MSVTEIKIEVLKRGKNMRWLVKEFGTSKTYLYRGISEQNLNVLKRIMNILERTPKS